MVVNDPPQVQGWRKHERPAQRKNDSIENNDQAVVQMMGFLCFRLRKSGVMTGEADGER